MKQQSHLGCLRSRSTESLPMLEQRTKPTVLYDEIIALVVLSHDGEVVD